MNFRMNPMIYSLVINLIQVWFKLYYAALIAISNWEWSKATSRELKNLLSNLIYICFSTFLLKRKLWFDFYYQTPDGILYQYNYFDCICIWFGNTFAGVQYLYFFSLAFRSKSWIGFSKFACLVLCMQQNLVTVQWTKPLNLNLRVMSLNLELFWYWNFKNCKSYALMLLSIFSSLLPPCHLISMMEELLIKI